MNNRIIASPLARRLAKAMQRDLSGIKGTGPHGRIIKQDILAITSNGSDHKNNQADATADKMVAGSGFEPNYKLVPLTNMRRVIAERLTLSKTSVPHFYLTVDCDLSRILELRQKLAKENNPESNQPKEKISINDILIKALAMAAAKVPESNGSFTNNGVKIYQSVDVSVAVAIAGGLITPIIRQADKKSLQTIAMEMKDLASRAKQGKLKPEEYQGGTISLSNLGMYGIKQFDAVINPPQACILAVGAGVETPVVKNGAVAVATIMTATLSCDHRVVDGAIGANFLKYFKLYVEDPALMFFA